MVMRVIVDDFRRAPMFLRIERVVAAILARGKIVAPIDVLVMMDILAPKDLEDTPCAAAEERIAARRAKSRPQQS
jgi:hypothetical protein